MSETEFHMMRAILSQPAAVREAPERNRDVIAAAAESALSKASKNIYLIGTGTSLHAAEIASYFFSTFAPGINPLPISSYEFVNYTPPIRDGDLSVVISHRGYKRYSRKSLQISREHGLQTVAVTGLNSSLSEGDADFILSTVEQEVSSAHTVSFTSALSVLLSLSMSMSPDRHSAGEVRSLLRKIAESMERIVEARSAVSSRLSELYGQKEITRVWISGGGPDRITAKEGALKLQETSYIDAYGFEIEQLIHGPVRASSLANDMFVPIIWGNGGHAERSREFCGAIAHAGGRILTVSDTPSDTGNLVPCGLTLNETVSPFVTVLPLQLIAFYLAMLRGTDPDSFRSGDPAFARIDAELKL
ncbi:MAG: SIS domain-containing protein [Thermoplasmata archaeon YP2-bin.285]|uniref:SIS domain-containing protein n=1 Tax=Candidatus Sysuiplasma superficiale TaxID=2823368 RepID=A0A8J7YTA1_9ARCH|nr:SIS domain-containing protein [Candidatus Sysuiplasma superficiale]